jgi:arginyl-tRNA synthetase
MVFDWEQALNLEGDSGPYAQYAYVRTHSILSKAEGKPGTSSKYIFSPEEKKLIRRLCEFPELVQKSARDLSVQYLPEYSLDVATDFNKFYATSSVLNAETKDAKKSRLAIVQATSIVLENSLGLLGIECPEKM